MNRQRMTEEKRIEAGLEDMWMDYWERVSIRAATIFYEIVKPYCVKRGFDFIAGMGTWYMGNEKIDIWDLYLEGNDRELAKIVDILQLDVPGLPANDLGSLMPDYRRSDDQEAN